MVQTQNHPRYAYAKAILGEELFSRLSTSRVLVVGAGGIGCELLKNLVLVGFGHVDIIDLDTIDLSNLNRQFLFQKSHIAKPKSIVAANTASSFNPLVEVKSFHSNIKEEGQFGWDYFSTFDVVCNALDNLDARRWVNAMCVKTGVPLVESGTTGFLGQVQPIMRGLTECYDCTSKPTPKTYPVCTIRSTPSTPIHCIVWAKTWLFGQLFGAEDENEDAELEKALQDGENAEEIANLRKEAGEMRSIRDQVQHVNSSFSETEKQTVAKRVFEKVFKHDVERLLRMEDMWKRRRRPEPLTFDEASKKDESRETSLAPSSLKDQRKMTVKELVELFQASLIALAQRASSKPGEPLSFDKDDDDALDFVTTTSNLRSHVYHIETKTRFEVKEMAGNIIPAIASTNAIIAGTQVMQTLHALWRDWDKARFVSLVRSNPARLVTSTRVSGPNPACGVCQDVYMRAKVDAGRCTLLQLIDCIRRSREEGGAGYEVEGIEVFEGTRLLADEEFDENVEKILAEIGLVAGKTATFVDEDGIKASLNVVLDRLDEKVSNGAVENGESLHVIELCEVDRLPAIQNKVKIAEKRAGSEDTDDDTILEVSAPSEPASARKRARLDEGKEEEEEKFRKRSRIEEAKGEEAKTGGCHSSAIALD